VEVGTLSVVCVFPEANQSFGSEVMKKFTFVRKLNNIQYFFLQRNFVAWNGFFHSLSGEMIWGQFKHMTSIVRFISIIITSAPPRINRHEIPEAGDPYTQESELQTTGVRPFSTRFLI